MSRMTRPASHSFATMPRLRGLGLCAVSFFLLASAAVAQDAPAPNSAPPAASTPPPSAKSDQPPANNDSDEQRPSLLKKPATTPPAQNPAPGAAPSSGAGSNGASSGSAQQGNTTSGNASQGAAPTTDGAQPNASAPNAAASPATGSTPSAATAPQNGTTPSAPATASSPSPASNSSQDATAGASATQNSTSTPVSVPAGTPAANSTATPVAQPAGEPLAEMTTHSSQIPLESHVNLVPVRVVVHDGKGNVVTDLREADFEIRQDGKAQVISHFSVETPASLAAQVVRGTEVSTSMTEPTTQPTAGTLALPSRFVAMVIDDAHLNFGDLTRLRVAAIRYVNESLTSNERVALYTVSGQSQVDFTDDHDKIINQLKVLIPRPVGAFDPETQQDCLKITYYQADLIQNQNDSQAISAADADALVCVILEGAPQSVAQTMANALVASTAAQVLQAGNLSTQYTVRRLDEIVRRISAMPGQRSMVLISPGFLTPTYEYDVSQVVDRATRQNVFINVLDARGLYTVDPLGDISQRLPVHASPATSGLSLQYRIDEQRAQSEVLSDLANSTGGFYFRNNNDLDAGLRQTAAEPAVSYLLAFVPSGIKNDGKFHTISVKMLTKEHYTVQARRGFFAPKHGKTPAELAKQDIEDAVFSQEEQQGLPVQLHLQYFKVDAGNAKLSVLTHVDIAQVQFDRNDGRNSDDLTIVAALFDRNGNFISADQKTLEMRLKDATLDKLHQSGLTVKSNFDVKPGGYLVRLVVRDSKASQLASRNGVVEIP